MKICRNCKENKEIELFPFFSTSEAGRKNTCKECSKKLGVLRKKLKSENPVPNSGPCPICKTFTDHWILDHCHFSDKFRGYICNNCNLALGRFNDDIELLKAAIYYLEQNNTVNIIL